MAQNTRKTANHNCEEVPEENGFAIDQQEEKEPKKGSCYVNVKKIDRDRRVPFLFAYVNINSAR